MNTASEFQEVIFTGDGDFEALYAAEKWLKSQDISWASLCSPHPTALMRGDVMIAKWRNLTQAERYSSDGIMTAEGGSYRRGPITVRMRNSK